MVAYPRISWSSETKTVEKFLSEYVNILNNDPRYQRGMVEPNYHGGRRKASKYQGIIESVILGYDLGEITIIRTEPGSSHPYETLDGANRIRALYNFRNNKFPLHATAADDSLTYLVNGKRQGKYYKDLDADQRKAFDNFVMRIVFYQTVSSAQKGMLFRLRNGGTPVNHMEMLNAYGDAPMATLVRGLVRQVDGVDTVPHSLFDSKAVLNQNTGDYEVTYEYLKFANKRLVHDEMVARIVAMYWQGSKIAPCGNKTLDKMYEIGVTEEDAVLLAKKVKPCLDFLQKIAAARKSIKKKDGLASHEFTMLYRWHIWFTEESGPYNLLKPIEFYKSFERALNRYMGDDKDNWVLGTYKKATRGKNSVPSSDEELDDDEKGNRHLAGAKGAFAGALASHDSADEIRQSCLWLTQPGRLGPDKEGNPRRDPGFDPVAEGIVEVLDPKRTFSRKMIEEKLSQQGYTCWVSGSPLTLAEAEGAHVVAHSRGGKTVFNNLVVVHRDHNRAMGTDNAYDYRDRYLSTLQAAAA